MKKILLTLASLLALMLAFCFSASAVENYTFDTVDDKTTSLYSEDTAVTVNIFGSTTCTNTQQTIYNILSAGIDKKENVLIVNMEETATITTIIDEKIYDVKTLEVGSKEVLEKINNISN